MVVDSPLRNAADAEVVTMAVDGLSAAAARAGRMASVAFDIAKRSREGAKHLRRPSPSELREAIGSASLQSPSW